MKMNAGVKNKAITIGLMVIGTLLLTACESAPKARKLTPGEVQKVSASASIYFKKSVIINGEAYSGNLQLCEAVDSDGNSFTSCYGTIPKVIQSRTEGNANPVSSVGYISQTVYVDIDTGVISLKNPDVSVNR